MKFWGKGKPEKSDPPKEQEADERGDGGSSQEKRQNNISPDNKALLNAIVKTNGIFALDIVRQSHNQAILWRRFAFICLTCCFFAMLAIMFLTPLKRVEVYVYGVDKITGANELVTFSDAKSVIKNIEVLDVFWLNRFVESFWGYSSIRGQFNYDSAMLFSDTRIQPRVKREFNRNIERYVNKVHVLAMITSAPVINHTTKDTKVATFFMNLKVIPNGMDNLSFETRQFVKIWYTYEQGDMSQKSRNINPAGFKVLDYEVSKLQNERTINSIMQQIDEIKVKENKKE